MNHYPVRKGFCGGSLLDWLRFGAPSFNEMTNDNSASIVSKVWNYAHVLKNAGVGYGDYVEQITYLLFLKLAEEMTELGAGPADLNVTQPYR